MSTLNMEALDLLKIRLAQVTSILDVLFLAGSESDMISVDQMTDGLWAARELLKQATEASWAL